LLDVLAVQEAAIVAAGAIPSLAQLKLPADTDQLKLVIARTLSECAWLARSVPVLQEEI
jgi:hypothetical protein